MGYFVCCWLWLKKKEDDESPGGQDDSFAKCFHRDDLSKARFFRLFNVLLFLQRNVEEQIRHIDMKFIFFKVSLKDRIVVGALNKKIFFMLNINRAY